MSKVRRSVAMRQDKLLNGVLRDRKLKLKLALVLALLVGCSAVALVSRANNQPVSKALGIEASAAAQAQTRELPRQLVRVFVHPDDIYPSIVRVRPGNLLLRAENETQTDVSLILERVVPGQARQRVTRVSTSGRAKRTDNRLNLGVGEYVFFEESRPEVQGRLIVEAR